MDNDTKVAIIGYSGSFPGADSPEKLWELSSQGKVGLQETEEDAVQKNLPEDFYKKSNFKAIGGGPRDFKTFDARFFGYSPKEAILLDPQIRKSLEAAWNAFEHAGYAPNQVECPVGTYLASSLNSYFLENLLDEFERSNESERSQILFLNEPDFLSTRIAYQFNWSGPAFTIKCGCSSSLVAIHEACKALLNYDCDLALSGGVAIKPRYHYGYLYEKEGILSENGKCCPFSNEATGTIFANGVGMVVLKRLSDAIEDGDTIHGIIRASAVNNDAQDKVGYMAPSVSGQTAAMRLALAYAELNPEDINYIETHGTGTEIGDPIEFKGLVDVFGNCPIQSIPLGALKGNIGHLDAASGVASIIKVLQDLKHKTVSPIMHFNEANPKVGYENSPFKINKHVSEWAPGPKGRIAAISSFGIGGTNAQLILEEYQNLCLSSTNTSKYFFPLSTKTSEALELFLDSFQKFIQDNPSCCLGDISYTLVSGRTHFTFRWGCIAESYEELCEKLKHSKNELISTTLGEEIVLDKDLFNDAVRLEKLWFQGTVIRSPEKHLEGFRRIPLPGYPFSKVEYWKDKGNQSQKIQDPSKWFYLPYWKREQISVCLPDFQGKNVLIFAENSGLSDELQERVNLLKAKSILVYAAGSYSRSVEGIYNIRPGSDKDFTLLLEDLEKAKMFPDIILHAWNFEKNETDFDKVQQQGLYSFVALCKASVKVKGTASFLLSIICNGIANVSGDESVHPNKSTLLGISQVYPKEYEGAVCQLIDISTSISHSLNVNTILHELSTNQSCEVALRGMRRFVKDYVPHHLSDDKLGSSRLDSRKNYLIIGGLGNFGMELAEFIATQHQSNLFLTTRTTFPPASEWDKWLREKGKGHSINKKILQIQEIAKSGSAVEILKADVSKREDLETIHQKIQEEHGPVSGIIHAAGVVESGMIQNKTIESFNQVFAAKVFGTRNVCDVFLPDNPDFIILCSSMNSIIGGLGQVDNTAANAFVDAYAEYCVNLGHENVFAINWGAVNEARARNYSALPQFADLSREHIKNKMTKGEIFDVYRRLFSTHLGPRVVVSTINFSEVIKNWNRVGSLRELIKEANVAKKSRSDISSHEYLEPKTKMEKAISRCWQNLLGIDKISKDDDFFELGGNSLVAIQFIGELTAEFPIKVHAMSIYEYPTLESFAAYAEQLETESKEKSELMKAEL